jgi:hypothetical protein
MSLKLSSLRGNKEKFCAENGNPIKIVDYGENFDLENTEISPEVLEAIGIENSDLAKLLLKFSKSYLNGPIFTDSFHKDHRLFGGRREWENNSENLMDKETSEYYKTNRLGINNCWHVIGFLDVLLDDIKDFKTKNELEDIKNNIPKELTEKDKDDILEYSKLADDKHEEIDGKIEVIKKFSDITQKLLSFLEKKS